MKVIIYNNNQNNNFNDMNVQYIRTKKPKNNNNKFY